RTGTPPGEGGRDETCAATLCSRTPKRSSQPVYHGLTGGKGEETKRIAGGCARCANHDAHQVQYGPVASRGVVLAGAQVGHLLPLPDRRKSPRISASRKAPPPSSVAPGP